MDAVTKLVKTVHLLCVLLITAIAMPAARAQQPDALLVSGWGEAYDGIYYRSGSQIDFYQRITNWPTFITKIGDNPWVAGGSQNLEIFHQASASVSPVASGGWVSNLRLDTQYAHPKVAVREKEDASNADKDKALTEEPINTISGNMVHEETDLALPSAGVELKLRRVYNSGMSWTNSPLGPRWSHNYEWALAQTTKVSVLSGMTFSNECLVIRSGDGCLQELLRYETNLTWRAYRGGGWSATPDPNGGFTVDIPREGRWLFDSNGVLTAIRDYWGNALTFSYENEFPSNRLSRVAHSNGRYLDFSYTNNLLAGVTTPASNLFLRYAYGASGELTNAVLHTSVGDRSTRYAYDQHSMTQRVNAAGDVFSYTYATTGEGEAATRCTGMSLNGTYYNHTVAYHTNDNFTEVTYALDETNRAFVYHYGTNLQKLTRIDGPGGTNRQTAFTYEPMYGDLTDEVHQDSSLSPSETLRIVRSYDDRHNVTTEALGYQGNVTNAWSYAWHELYQLPTLIIDPEGCRAEVDYTNGSPSALRLLDGEDTVAETRISYFTNGLPEAVTNANGHYARFLYSASGNVTSAIPQAGPAIALTWSSLGILESIRLPGDEEDTNSPPNMLPRVTTFQSDEQGLVSRITYPDSSFASFSHDVMRRLTNYTDVAGRAHALTYAPGGSISAYTRYLTSEETNQAVTTAFTYDRQFGTLAIRDPLARVVEAYVLDLQERPITITNLEGQTMSVSYGLGPIIHSVTRFDGSVVSNLFDTAGRIIETRYPDATNCYGYLGNNLLVWAANPEGVVSNSFDGANRLVHSASLAPTGAVNYSHYPAGQVSNFTSVAGAVGHVLDEGDRVSAIQTPVERFEYAYNTNNGLVETVHCTNSGLRATMTYNNMDQMTGITWLNASNQVIRRFVYGYNTAGLVESIEREDGSRSEYGFDSLDRLIGETQKDAMGTLVIQESIGYDLAGNRTGKERDGLRVNYQMGVGNRLAQWSVADTNLVVQCDVLGGADEAIGTGNPFGQLWVSNTVASQPVVMGNDFAAYGFQVSLGTQSLVAAICDVAGNTTFVTNTVFFTVVTNAAYGYSLSGCLTGMVFQGVDYRRETSLAWDGEYHLRGVRCDGVDKERYGYDGLGRRAWTWDGVATNWHVYDREQVVADVDATGGLVRSYFWGPGIDNLLALTVHTGVTAHTYLALKDHLGTVHALVDRDGHVVESYRFDAWGRVLGVYDGSGNVFPVSQVGNRFAWQGREYSWNTGLYYFRARWYDPVTGRWLSNDPVGISGGLNQYVAFKNNPVNYRDPDGRAAQAIALYVLGKGLIGGGLGALSGGLAGLFDSPTGNLSWKNAGKGVATGFAGGFIAGAGSTIPVVGDIGGAALGGVVSSALYSKWQGEDICSNKSKRSMFIGGWTGVLGGVIDSFWEVPFAGPISAGAAGAGYNMLENLISSVKNFGDLIRDERARQMEQIGQ